MGILNSVFHPQKLKRVTHNFLCRNQIKPFHQSSLMGVYFVLYSSLLFLSVNKSWTEYQHCIIVAYNSSDFIFLFFWFFFIILFTSTHLSYCQPSQNVMPLDEKKYNIQTIITFNRHIFIHILFFLLTYIFSCMYLNIPHVIY